MGDSAAALTYYALLALFPALLLAVGVLGLFGQAGLVTDATAYFTRVGFPPQTVDVITSFLRSAIHNDKTAVGALVLGALTAVYACSNAFGALGRALNVVARVSEDRPLVRRKLHDAAWTLALLALLLAAFVMVFLGGGLASDVFRKIGLGETAANVWRALRWPLALATVLMVYAIIYATAPEGTARGVRWITPGALVGVGAWMLASYGFFEYVANFGSYNKTYGAFAGIIVLLVWMWIGNVALLYGAELNAAIGEREQA